LAKRRLGREILLWSALPAISGLPTSDSAKGPAKDREPATGRQGTGDSGGVNLKWSYLPQACRPPGLHGGDSMTDLIQADNAKLAPSKAVSFVSAELPDLSDNECVTRLARASLS